MMVLDAKFLSRAFRMMLLAVLGMIAIFTEAAPLGLSPQAQPSPDLLLCVVAYFAIRRPGSCPALLVFALGLIRDLLTDVPVGIGALTLVLAAEAFRALSNRLIRSTFLLEWLTLAGAALITVTLQWVVLLLSLAQPPYLYDLLHQSLFTAGAYLLIAPVFRWLLRISWRKPEPA